MDRSAELNGSGKLVNTEANERKLLGLLPVFILIVIVVLRISWTLYRAFGQKTRSPQPRRMYVGSRARLPSLAVPETTVYVSPNNLPPPPKYECMAPPSYEEVVGIHYPNYSVQPIAQPIAAALAQGTNATQPVTATPVDRPVDQPVESSVTLPTVTVTSEDRTTTAVRS